MTVKTVDIKTRLNIADVIGDYVKLTRKGRNYWGLCPFHNENTPSFCVTPSKNMFYCYGCNLGGDIFTFIMRFHNVDFKAAKDILAAKAGLRTSGKLSRQELEQMAVYKQHKEQKARIVEQLEGAITEETNRLIEMEKWAHTINRTITTDQDLSRSAVDWALRNKDRIAAALDDLLTVDPIEQLAIINLTGGWKQWPQR